MLEVLNLNDFYDVQKYKKNYTLSLIERLTVFIIQELFARFLIFVKRVFYVDAFLHAF